MRPSGVFIAAAVASALGGCKTGHSTTSADASGATPRAQTASELFTEHPQTETATLSDGFEFKLPIHYTDANAVCLIGTGDLDYLRSQMAREGLRPAEVAPGRGMIILYIIDYRESSIGPYGEILVLVPTEPMAPTSASGLLPLPLMRTFADLTAIYNPLRSVTPGADISRTRLFAWKLFVDRPNALTAGIEVWGYPKSLAAITLERTEDAISYSVSTDAGPVFSGSLRAQLPAAASLPMNMSFISVTPKEHKQTLTNVMARGVFRLEAYASHNMLTFNPASDWGRKLLDAKFTPYAWQDIPEMVAVLPGPFETLSAAP